MMIRNAATQDAAGIAAVHVASWQAVYRGIVPQPHLDRLSVADREAGWVKILKQPESKTLVADREGEIVGFSSYGRSRDEDAVAGTGELYAIYVAPSHWSTGAGRALWERTRQGLADLGCTIATVWVLAANERAIRFYKQAGFRLCAGSEAMVKIGGEELPEVRYETVIA